MLCPDGCLVFGFDKLIMPRASSHFVYFAYGSNMLTRRLTATDRAPSAVPIGTGYVSNRRLTFDKVSRDGSGKCDIEITISSTDRVYGILFEISSTEKSSLDSAEGLGEGYRKEQIQVVTPNGEAYEAIAYVATKKDPALRPYDWYKALVIAGATEHKLPHEYVEWLRTLDSVVDPNANRRSVNESLLCAR